MKESPHDRGDLGGFRRRRWGDLGGFAARRRGSIPRQRDWGVRDGRPPQQFDLCLPPLTPQAAYGVLTPLTGGALKESGKRWGRDFFDASGQREQTPRRYAATPLSGGCIYRHPPDKGGKGGLLAG